MSTLGKIPKIEYYITHANLAGFKALHKICFGNEGEPRKTQKALREFSGFGWGKNTDEYVNKIQDISQLLKLSDLIAVCNILGLNYNGALKDVADHICTFLTDSMYRDDEQEEKDADDESEHDKEDNENEDVDDEQETKNEHMEEEVRQHNATTKRSDGKDCFR